MKSQIVTNLKTITIFCLVISTTLTMGFLKDGNANSNQPMSNLDKLIRQSSAQVKLDNLLDSKLTSNLSSVLNEVAMSINKMVLENRRLTAQVQEVMARVQNTTGINGTTTMVRIQQQTPNMTKSINQLSLSNMKSINEALASRFQT